MNYELWLYVGMAAMVVVGLALLLPPLMKYQTVQERDDDKHRQALAMRLQEAHRELKAKYEAGHLSEAEFKSLEEDLERQALEETQTIAALPQAQRGGQLGPVWIVAIMAVVISIPFALYTWLGSPDLPRLSAAQVVLEGNANKEALEAYLKDNKRDGRAWYLLAHKYVDENELDKAIYAYEQARDVSAKVANDTRVSVELATLLLMSREEANIEKAYTLLRQARQASPGDAQILELLVMSEVGTLRYLEAQKDMERFLEAIGTSHPEYMRNFEAYQEIKRRAAVQGKKNS